MRVIHNALRHNFQAFQYIKYPPPCLPALHGVLFEIRIVLAGTSSVISSAVRESDRGERDDISLWGAPAATPSNHSPVVWQTHSVVWLCFTEHHYLLCFMAICHTTETQMFKNARRGVQAPGKPDPCVIVWQIHSVVWQCPQKLCYLLYFMTDNLSHYSAAARAKTTCLLRFYTL